MAHNSQTPIEIVRSWPEQEPLGPDDLLIVNAATLGFWQIKTERSGSTTGVESTFTRTVWPEEMMVDGFRYDYPGLAQRFLDGRREIGQRLVDNELLSWGYFEVDEVGVPPRIRPYDISYTAHNMWGNGRLTLVIDDRPRAIDKANLTLGPNVVSRVVRIFSSMPFST